MDTFLRRLAPVGALALMAFPVSAQDGADWNLLDNPRERTTVAFAEFDGGLVIASRCVGGLYEVAIGGLPQAPGSQAERPLAVAFGDEPLRESRWIVANDRTTAASDSPASLARRLREGGLLRIQVPGAAPGGGAVRYELEVPASSSAIDRTLSACGQATGA